MFQKIRITRSVTITVAALGLVALQGCANKVVESSEPAATPEPMAMILPDIDYSSESPDCETAGQRLADNIEVGMTLGDVRRLVGKPVFRLPGSWWWSRGLSKTGKPFVEFDLVLSNDDVKVKKVSTSVSGC